LEKLPLASPASPFSPGGPLMLVIWLQGIA
jgi:hypothetical protein